MSSAILHEGQEDAIAVTKDDETELFDSALPAVNLATTSYLGDANSDVDDLEDSARAGLENDEASDVGNDEEDFSGSEGGIFVDADEEDGMMFDGNDKTSARLTTGAIFNAPLAYQPATAVCNRLSERK